MIRLENVSKKYGNQVVMDNFRLEIKDGERIAIMGRSGAGKTTLIRLILGLEKADSGKVITNKDALFGVVFQEDRLIETLSCVGNISVASNENAGKDNIIRLLSSLGLDGELIYKPVSNLSGGEKRRVSIARALARNADIYILDEPFKGIDVQTLDKVIETVNGVTEGKTVIMITHSEEEANKICSKIIEI